jgi:hypothetical protein
MTNRDHQEPLPAEPPSLAQLDLLLGALESLPTLPGVTASDAIRMGGGYRWSDGQSLSLQVTGGRALGLQVSYDWPRYFVRLSYDSKLNLNPPDLRFSAGMRF